MTIRTWPAAKIKRLWRIGFAAEVGLVLLGVAIIALDNAHERRQQEAGAQPAQLPRTALTPQQRDSLARAARALLDSARVRLSEHGDTSTFAFNDSTSVSVVVSNDTIRHVSLSPAAQHALANVLEPPFRALSQVIRTLMWRVLLILGIIYMPIPLTLGGITVYWRATRDHAGPSERADA